MNLNEGEHMSNLEENLAMQEAKKLARNKTEEQALENLESELIQLNKTQMGRRVFIQAVPMLLTACATVPQTRVLRSN